MMIKHAECKKCGEPFQYERVDGAYSGALRKYCDEHSFAPLVRAARRAGRSCVECGTDISGLHGRAIFCSSECKKSSTNARKREENSKPGPAKAVSAVCKECGLPFSYEQTWAGRPREVCSDECKKAIYGRALAERREATAKRLRTEAFKLFDKRAIRINQIADRVRRECAYCGVTFIPIGYSNKGHLVGIPRQLMCGKGCSTKAAADAAKEKIARIMAGDEPMPEAKAAYLGRVRARRLLIKEVDALRRIGSRIRGLKVRDCEACGNPFTPKGRNEQCCSIECDKERKRQKEWEKRRGSVVECSECGAVFSPLKGNKGRTVCSDECEHTRLRRYKNNSKRKRRASMRGSDAELIDSRTVFKRDGWACCCCGEPSPQSLAGSGADNEPTIDHIIPLAMGGKHTYENVQLLCRVCNTLKGERTWESFLAEYGCGELSAAWFDLEFHLPVFGQAQRMRPGDDERLRFGLDIAAKLPRINANQNNHIPRLP